ncbi:hypothetical protein [Bradyrhizobium sp. SEMIA]|uniref:hypothetical protein n=1 Tax=Bradyrhizobium sp. SEMIA TaxID=2597515 RepID=UPI0018A40739|nr:hypothetical protein [Bradyrhizobium sp. SEMIA]QOG20477.1 hypothetical protein FOM02_27105 [Bradyrhizobium sp. SEMIA]
MLLRTIVALALAGALPARAADVDPYACFGWARYVAMGEGFRCSDLPAFCAGAHALLSEAGGDRRAAEKLARGRGHSRMAISLAKRFCD